MKNQPRLLFLLLFQLIKSVFLCFVPIYPHGQTIIKVLAQINFKHFLYFKSEVFKI